MGIHLRTKIILIQNSIKNLQCNTCSKFNSAGYILMDWALNKATNSLEPIHDDGLTFFFTCQEKETWHKENLYSWEDDHPLGTETVITCTIKFTCSVWFQNPGGVPSVEPRAKIGKSASKCTNKNYPAWWKISKRSPCAKFLRIPRISGQHEQLHHFY